MATQALAPNFSRPRQVRKVARTDAMLWASQIALVLFVVWPRYVGLFVGPLKANPSIIWQAGLIVMGVAKLFGRGGNATRQRATRSPIIISACIFILYELVTTVFGSKDASAYLWVRSALSFESLIIVGWVFGKSAQRADTLVRLVFFASLAAFSIAIIEYAIQTPFMSIFAAILPQLSDDQVLPLITAQFRDNGFRALSTFPHPIILSLVAGSMVPLFYQRATTPRTITQRALRLIPVLIALGAMWATGSRTGFASLGAAGVSYLLLMAYRSFVRTRSIALFLWGIVAVPAVLVALPIVNDVREGRTTTEAASTMIREHQWQQGRDAISGNPIFGHGTGSSPQLAGTTIDEGRGLTIDDTYLSLLVDDGFLGTALFGIFAFTVVVTGAGLVSRFRDGRQAKQLAALLALVVGVLVGQHFNSIPYAVGYLFLVAGFTASLSSHLQPVARARVRVHKTVSPWVRAK